MFRKVMIALLATAALGLLAPDLVSARGGGHGGFGGFHGGFHGFHGFHGGRFHRGGGFGRGGFHAAGFGRGGFHRAAFGGRRFRAGPIAGHVTPEGANMNIGKFCSTSAMGPCRKSAEEKRSATT